MAHNGSFQDILIAVVDGLNGFPEAITAAFPETMVQTVERMRSTVHLIRHSMNFCSWKDRKAVAADLRPIYEAPTASEAERQLETLEAKWGEKYRPSPRPGAGHGPRSSRSMPSAPRSGRSSTPRMPWSR